MAKTIHCGSKGSNVSAYRLASSKPAYRFQHVRHGLRCRACGSEFMEWRGEYPAGDKFTPWYPIPKAELDHWKRRIKAGEAKPEAQLMSEWAERAAWPADLAISYHNTIKAAQQRYPKKI